MLRLISVLLFLGGIAAAALGGMILMEEAGMPRIGSGAETTAELDEWPAVPVEDDAQMEPEIVMAEAPPPPPAAMEMPEPVMEEPVFEEAPMTGMPAPTEDSAADESPTRSLTMTTESEPAAGSAMGEMASGIESAASTPVPFSASVSTAQPALSPEEQFLQSLKTVPVAHETPTSAGYKQSFDVTLAIDATGDDDATDALPGRGNVVAGEAQVSNRVEARLSGAAFDIEATSPGTQTLSPVTENTWRWSVTALSPGEHDLVFEIFAIDQDAATPLRTYRDTVSVEVTGISRAIAFADQANPVFVLLGGLGSAVAGLFGVISFFRRRRA